MLSQKFEKLLWFRMNDDLNLGHRLLSSNEPKLKMSYRTKCARMHNLEHLRYIARLLSRSKITFLCINVLPSYYNSSLYFISPRDPLAQRGHLPKLVSLEVIWCHTKIMIHINESFKRAQNY